MTVSFTLAAIFFLGSGCLAGIAALAAALHIFVSGIYPNPGLAQYLCCFSTALSVPLAGMLAGMLVEEFAHPELRLSCYRQLATVLCAAAVLSNPLFYDYLASALQLASSFSVGKALSFMCAYGSAVFFCASLTALVLMLFSMLPEILVRWISGTISGWFFVPYGALRQLLVLIGFAASVNLITGLFDTELSPLKVLLRLPQ